MSNERLDRLTNQQIIDAVKQAGSWNKAAEQLDVPRATFQRRARKVFAKSMREDKLAPPVQVSAPKRGVKRFIFSSAQTNTAIHEGFLTNLEAYAAHFNAKIHVSGFAYATSPFDDTSKHSDKFHPRVIPYLTNDRFDIDGKLFFCGEMNTLPTATDPLSGFETYTRSNWGIFPHPRITLKSIATMFKAPPKIIMTTGALTKPNYIHKKAGLKAEFHHVIAAVLVEIDDEGDFFCRHLIAERDGAFQDLDVRVAAGKVTTGHTVEAIVWGDIHAERLDPLVAAGSWGLNHETFDFEFGDNMLDVLQPKYQFFHDALDFRRRNHHNVGDPHFRFEMWRKGTESVKSEIGYAAEFLSKTQRPWSTSIVVDSNHDRALLRWLKTGDYKSDPINAPFFLRAQAAIYEAIEKEEEGFMIAEWAMRDAGHDMARVKFLDKTDSFIICPKAGGGIECGLHGDIGSNGGKGDVRSFARMGPKANVAHHHGAAIFEGIYQAGHACRRDMVYNRGGLSSWNPSHIVNYRSGKRVIVTMMRDKWRA